MKILYAKSAVKAIAVMDKSGSDDIATPEDLRAHDVAMEEYLAGEAVPHEMIDWD